jgi:hypothetical protein
MSYFSAPSLDPTPTPSTESAHRLDVVRAAPVVDRVVPVSTRELAVLLIQKIFRNKTARWLAAAIAQVAAAVRIQARFRGNMARTPLMLELKRVEFRRVGNIDNVQQCFDATIFVMFLIPSMVVRWRKKELLKSGLKSNVNHPPFRSAQFYLSKLEFDYMKQGGRVERFCMETKEGIEICLVGEGTFHERMELHDFTCECACCAPTRRPLSTSSLGSPG